MIPPYSPPCAPQLLSLHSLSWVHRLAKLIDIPHLHGGAESGNSEILGGLTRALGPIETVQWTVSVERTYYLHDLQFAPLGIVIVRVSGVTVKVEK